jgi:hypothetical protein
VTIRDLGIDLEDTATGAAVRLDEPQFGLFENLHIDNVTAHNTASRGFLIENSGGGGSNTQTLTFRKIWMNDCKIGIETTAFVDGLHLQDIHIDTEDTTNGYGIKLSHVPNNFIMTGVNNITKPLYAIYLSDAVSANSRYSMRISGLRVEQSTADPTKYGIYLDCAAGAPIRNLLIENTQISQVGFLYARNYDNLTILNCSHTASTGDPTGATYTSFDCQPRANGACILQNILVPTASAITISDDLVFSLGENQASANIGLRIYADAGDLEGTIAADDVTPDISGGQLTWYTSANTGATAITDLDNPVKHKIYTIICGSTTNASTISDAGNFALTAAWSPDTVGDSIRLYVEADNDYIEVGRSDI